MGKVTKVKELVLEMPDKMGLLAEVTGALRQEGVSMVSLCAYSMEGKAWFMMITDDNEKVRALAAGNGWTVSEKDVVMAEVKDQAGAAAEVADKLKAAGINLCYLYGTTCSCSGGTCHPDCTSRLVICSEGKADDILAALDA